MTDEIIGREAELDTIEKFLASFADRPVALVLDGEAGIGKTTLWQYGAELARERDCLVLASAPAAGEARLSFAAVGDLLDGVVDDVLPDLPEPRRRALEVALLLAESGGAPPDQRAVSMALLTALRKLAERRRVVLAIDDVQWLDPSSARALEFAARRLSTEPIAYLVSRRVTGRSSARPLALEGAAAELRLLRIGPLTLGAVRHLLRTKLGATLTRPTLRRVHAASGGNPFFALEIARALERRGGEPDPGRPLAVPGTLRKILKERLAALPPNTQAALATVAALAQPSVRAAALEDLDAAVDAGVIELEGERIRFTHPLLASTAYEAVGASERRRIHQRLAQQVEGAEERARHLALGSTGPDAQVAVALDQAVLEASSRGATDAACALADLAVRLTPPEQSENVVQRRLALADLQIRTGEVPRARSELEALLEALPAGHSRALVLHRLSGTRADDMSAAIELAQQAGTEAGDDALRSSIHQNLSSFFLWRDGLEPARREAQTALEFGERAGDAAGIASNMATVGFQDDLAGEPRGSDFWERAITFEDEASVPIYWGPRLAYGIHLTFQGRLAEARSTLQEARTRVAAESYEWAVAEVEFQLAEVERRAGNWDLALRHAETSLGLVEEMELEQDQGMALYSVAMVEAHLGLVEGARRHAQAGLAFGESVGDAHSRVFNATALGFLELSRGDDTAADKWLRTVWPFLASRGYGEPSFPPVLPNEIEALIALGELRDAAKLLGQLEERGRALGTPWVLSQASRCRGLLCAAEGDLEQAVVRLELAVDEHERSPEPFERGRTLLTLGRVLRRMKLKRAPRETLLEALDIFERVGAPLWANKAKAELARIGGRRAVGDVLTPTERRLSELIAEGLSNKEAAAALFVSPKTVEQRLSRIYAKLGIHSRTELARWVLKESPESKV